MRRGLLAAAALLALAAPAAASWGPGAELASVDWGRLEQANGGSVAVDVSGDGRYVVFQTRASNFFADGDADPPGRVRQGGVFRYDRVTREIALVADGDQLDEQTGELLLRGAAAPSVSDDGRYVAFSTAQPLVPQDGNDAIDVYVRDMAIPLVADRAAGGAFRLVSAKDGGDVPATYASPPTPLPGRNPGTAVYPGQAISGDGRYVAFRTVEQPSDLPDRPTADTPGGNVFVRDLVARRTVLASPLLDGSGPAGGALAPVVLSRDGSTVAWVGENAPLQTPMLPGESLDNGVRRYLWRRWDDAGARTRRVTGLADPDDPACPVGFVVGNDPQATGPCYGPLADVDSGFNDVGGRAPALSADGWTVAFVSGAAPRPAVDVDAYLDAYVTSMRPGVSRKAGTRIVTRGTTAANPRANGDVESVALSADGSRLLLVTARRQFLAPAPPFAGAARTSEGGNELYLADLGANELRRLLTTPGGGDVDGAVDANAALSADGRVTAFTASSRNLFAGDANELTDAFAVAEAVDRVDGPPPAIGGDPIDVVVVGGGAALRVRVRSRDDGSLLLRVAVPQAGKLDAVATAGERAGNARTRGDRRSGRQRRVAAARTQARRRGTVRLVLALRGRERRAVLRGAALRVRVRVTLMPRDGGVRRRASAAGTFRVPPRALARRHLRQRVNAG
ncbi:MAG TPA: hypothetical protein VFS37_02815 [Conexibacter sp.]|nr:hypothetical protein [Conexibacter sp.]